MADSLQAAANLARTLKQVFIATADDQGRPHVGVARSFDLQSDGRVAISEWFCPGTLANIEKRPRVALVVWDAKADRGFQLVGRVESIDTLAMMDGYDVTVEKRKPMPQVERRLVVHIDQVLDFTRAPHTDVEE